MESSISRLTTKASFDDTSPLFDYSFKSYLLYIRTKEHALSEDELESYLQWYRTDLNWAKVKKDISQQHFCRIRDASDASKVGPST
jgi:hypothetical protein